MNILKLRYPGTQPFEVQQKNIFFGRDADKENLYRLIKLEPLVVVHSKSGLGKSSLLNAGIIPEVLKNGQFEPVRIRFNAWTEGQDNKMPLSNTKEKIRKGKKSANTFLDKLIYNEETLWHDVKEFQILKKNQKGLLLIFDQFEELFTYPVDQIESLSMQLSEALNNKMPQRYWTVLEEMADEDLSDEDHLLLQIPLQLKVVLVIRSDRMSFLNKISDHIPSILKNCYELEALSIEQTKEAILLPTAVKGDFASQSFEYDVDALENILSFLTKGKKQGVASTQLQIVCNAMEKKVIDHQLERINLEHTANLSSVIEQYYDEKISLLKTEQQQNVARALIEDKQI